MSIKDNPALIVILTVVACSVFSAEAILLSKAIEFSHYTCTKTEPINGAAKCVVYELRGEVK